MYAALAALCMPARAQDQAEIIRQLVERIDKQTTEARVRCNRPRQEQYDESLPEIGVIPQGLSRVIVNISNMLYTDGVSEANNIAEEEYSPERLEACLASNTDQSAEGLVRQVISEVRTFTAGAVQSDDLTMLALKYTG